MMFSRTSIYRIIEFLGNYDINSFEELVEKFKARGHKRKENDIKTMLTQAEHAGLIQDWRLYEQFKDLELLDPNTTDTYVVRKVIQMLEYLNQNHLMVIPFLEAVEEVPSNAGAIAARAGEKCRNFGYYHVRVDKDDNTPAMKNFLAYMRLMKAGRGKYQLTPLGEKVVQHFKEPTALQTKRAQCDREICREICPADVIGPYEISTACVSCGLCMKACPYGGIDVINGRFTIDPFVCSSQSGSRKKTVAGSLSLILGQEEIMQNWLVSLFRLGRWQATIPGVGHYPDVVLINKPIWFECKTANQTKKTLMRVLDQIKGYQTSESINQTIDQVRQHTGKSLNPPSLFLLCAPASSDVRTFLDKSSTFSVPTGFLSAEALHSVADHTVRSNILIWDEHFPTFYESEDYSETIISNIRS